MSWPVGERPAGDGRAYGDKHGDIAVDAGRAHEVYLRWLARTRPTGSVSPDGTRRPRWLMRPVKPAAEAFALPADR